MEVGAREHDNIHQQDNDVRVVQPHEDVHKKIMVRVVHHIVRMYHHHVVHMLEHQHVMTDHGVVHHTVIQAVEHQIHVQPHEDDLQKVMVRVVHHIVRVYNHHVVY